MMFCARFENSYAMNILIKRSVDDFFRKTRMRTCTTIIIKQTASSLTVLKYIRRGDSVSTAVCWLVIGCCIQKKEPVVFAEHLMNCHHLAIGAEHLFFFSLSSSFSLLMMRDLRKCEIYSFRDLPWKVFIRRQKWMMMMTELAGRKRLSWGLPERRERKIILIKGSGKKPRCVCVCCCCSSS